MPQTTTGTCDTNIETTQASLTSIPMIDLQQEIAEIREDIDAAIGNTLDSANFIGGHEVEAFEKEAASYLDCKHAIGCNSGTDAILLALRALDVGPGDEVITSSFSFFATAEPISLLGAKPIFVDIDPDTYNIDAALIDAAITENTKAIVPVHLYGHPAQMETICAIAKSNGLAIIEDTAQAFGGRIGNSKLGTIGDVGAFSFFPSKTLGAFGDGGMICTDDDRLNEMIRKLRSHGSLIKYQNEILGYNSRLDAIQAAILRVKLARIDTQNSRRREVAKRYSDALRSIDGISTPDVTSGHVFHQYTVRIHNGHRDSLRAYLSDAGIASMIYYPTPIHRLPLYADTDQHLPNVDRACEEVISLPIWPGMPNDQQDYVLSVISSFAENI